MIFVPLAPHILHVFNSVFTTSCVPSNWKIAKVRPVPKKSSASTVSDFRPISILPALSKVWEVLAKDQVSEFPSCNNAMSVYQSGFRKGHSTITSLLDVTESIRSYIDGDEAAILLLLDFSKAFDTIDHATLCRKLKCLFSFSGSACNLMFSYLFGRKQCTVVGSSRSMLGHLIKGVPQGSVLGPLLFSMYINDLPRSVQHSIVHLFADDVQLLASGHRDDLRQCVADLNADLQSIASWAQSNSLILNPNKSQAIVVSRRPPRFPVNPLRLVGCDIPYLPVVTSLGLIINNALTWDDHVTSVCGNVFGVLRKLYAVKDFLSLEMRSKLIRSLVVPLLLYGCEIYSGCSVGCFNRLNLAFNCAIRFIFGLRRFDHVSPFVRRFLGCDLHTYFQIRVLIFLFKIISSRQPPYLYLKLCFARSTRNRQITIPAHASSVMDKSFLVRAARLWNRLPSVLKNASSVADFKQSIFDFFRLQP